MIDYFFFSTLKNDRLLKKSEFIILANRGVMYDILSRYHII